MAIVDNQAYRVHIDLIYSSTTNGASARSAINSALAGIGRSETCGGTGTACTLLISGLSEDDAHTIRDAVRPGWSSVTRTGGKVSVVRNNQVG